MCHKSPMEAPHEAPCGHMGCYMCWMNALKARPACPTCRNPTRRGGLKRKYFM
jgi:regulator of telomere elongation helicase 1